MASLFSRRFAVSAVLAMLPGGMVSAQAERDQAPRSLYVATNGNDAWSGTLAAPDAAGKDGPFATLQRARDEIRKWKGAGELAAPVTVWVRGGMYPFSEALVLEARDSGTAECPITYRAYGGETPILSGGRAVAGWQPYKGGILKAAITDPDLKGVRFRQLFCDGARMTLARYPNADARDPYALGWAAVAGKRPPMYTDIPGEDKRTLEYREEDTRDWARPQDGEVNIFARYNWWNNIVPIQSIDRAKRTITLAANCSYPIRPEDRYFVQGMFEELDAPGEWYVDVDAATLYFWPPEGADPATLTVHAPVLPALLDLGPDTAHVTFRGFTVECCHGTAIRLRQTRNCRIAACTVRGVGDYQNHGVRVDGGKDNGVVGCDISDVGHDGIQLTGGDRITLTPCGNYADNNYIHHPGVYFKWGR